MSLRVERRRNDGRIVVCRELLVQRVQVKRRHARNLVVRRADTKPGIDLLSDTPGEIGSGNLVDGIYDPATQQASEESDDPFRAILAPDQELVAFANSLMSPVRARTDWPLPSTSP